MRRRRKGKTQDHQLRQFALAGRWHEVHHLLEKRLALAPDDEDARAELERLRQGIPLRATETALMRKQRQERDMGEELEAALTRFRSAPAEMDEWKPALLSRRRKRVALILSTIAHKLPGERKEEATLYLSALDERLTHHRSRSLWLRLLGIGLPVLGTAGTFAAIALGHQAGKAENHLRAALGGYDVSRVENALKVADSGINRSLNRKLATLIPLAERWLARRERELGEMERLIIHLETGESRISTLPLSQRISMTRTLRYLPQGSAELRERWQRLCAREQQQLDRQKAEAEQQLKTPLPPMPALTGIPATDQDALLQHQKDIRIRAREGDDACELFGLDTALATPIHERLTTLNQLLSDLAALRRTTALLPTARSYAQYRSLLEENTPKLYAPALRMMEICKQLPDEDKLRDQMQDHGRQLPPGMLEAARHALLEKGPTFTPAFHANAKQVQIMEDVFTATTLQKVLYQISTPGQPTYIIEQLPEVGEEQVRFTPSPLTPGYSFASPKFVIWDTPTQVYLRTIDATSLLPAIGITREHFFQSGNIPHLLDRLLQREQGICPTLARAYLFNRLLEVMRAHEWPTMLGIAYAPTLRADARSFRKLVQTAGLRLDAACWLQATPEAARAEEAFKRWFHERRYHCYAREIERNFGALVQVHPRYVGYIDETETPALYRSLPRGTLLWYMAEGGLTTTASGEELEKPVLFSPIFIVERD